MKKNKITKGHPVKGKKYPRMSEARKKEWADGKRKPARKKGCIPWNKGIKMIKHGRNPVWLKSHQFKSGNQHPKWEGGKFRKNHEAGIYKKWTRKVFERDNFTCQKCGQKGGKLEAHHIKS